MAALKLNVCMLGARGVGKTSVLTSIFDDYKSSQGVGDSMLMLRAKEDTRIKLSEKKISLQEVFDNRVNITDQPRAGIEATSEVNSFDFEFGLLGNEPTIDLTITDYPGEFIEQNQEFVNEQILASSAIIVAIDTPYLMENDGLFDEAKNQTSTINRYLIDNIDSMGGSGKLVLFVPLKCEKYFSTNQLDELCERVQDSYKEAIDKLKRVENVAIAITPIKTMGDILFMEFVNDIAKYKFSGDNPKFAPRFCVQPIYYLLSFIAKQFEIYHNRRWTIANTIDKIREAVCSYFNNDKTMLEEVRKVGLNRLDGKLGYKVICGENMFYSK